jgi:hypothetical protein
MMKSKGSNFTLLRKQGLPNLETEIHSSSRPGNDGSGTCLQLKRLLFQRSFFSCPQRNGSPRRAAKREVARTDPPEQTGAASGCQ